MRWGGGRGEDGGTKVSIYAAGILWNHFKVFFIENKVGFVVFDVILKLGISERQRQ